MLSVKQGSVKYHFFSLWYDWTWDWTKVSRAIGEQSNHYANVRLIGLVDKVFDNGRRDLGSIPDRVIPKTLKMVLDTSLLNTHIIRYVSRVKWSNPGKGVAPSLTPRCCSYWKRSLLVALGYGRQLYFWLCTYM